MWFLTCRKLFLKLLYLYVAIINITYKTYLCKLVPLTPLNTAVTV